jgi:peptidoglycan hydrolase FlgJ
MSLNPLQRLNAQRIEAIPNGIERGSPEEETAAFSKQLNRLLEDAETAAVPSVPEGSALSMRAAQRPGKSESEDALKDAFCDFVGQTLFAQVIQSMRSAQGEPAYFHGGQAERIFQGQLDQILTEEISKASSESVAGPMYELFRMKRP